MNGHFIQNDTPIPRIPWFNGSINASQGSGYSTASGTIRGATMKRWLVQSLTGGVFFVIKTIICAKQELTNLLFLLFFFAVKHKFPEKTTETNNSNILNWWFCWFPSLVVIHWVSYVYQLFSVTRSKSGVRQWRPSFPIWWILYNIYIGPKRLQRVATIYHESKMFIPDK